ncbi:t22.13 [Tupaiid betaherpesvirus 1]|uniref:T22.13 n=1 Tax=Tupaiid herpesvirus 1 (strain 1) TaxID=10397 RepID=Q91TS6_TUHV1|nr:t22.13 [Tupaiid betaherpesvirus 1]AAK57061.1 t22.13 [Tupaiid betaherpesvirus 1]
MQLRGFITSFVFLASISLPSLRTEECCSKYLAAKHVNARGLKPFTIWAPNAKRCSNDGIW